jgi:hypothetical protein
MPAELEPDGIGKQGACEGAQKCGQKIQALRADERACRKQQRRRGQWNRALFYQDPQEQENVPVPLQKVQSPGDLDMFRHVAPDSRMLRN